MEMMSDMTDSYYMSVTDTAKLVRQALAKTFPGVKFSVRSSKYAGGASIDVSWEDGPQSAAVDEVLSSYQGADFDGMIDLKTSNSHWLLADGTTRPSVTQIGHSYGSTTYGADGEPVSEEDAHDYRLGVRWGAGVTNTIEPRDRGSAAFQRGFADGEQQLAEGARLVHFGADFIHGSRSFSDRYRKELEHAVIVLSCDPGEFDNNRRYSFGILTEGENAGRAYEDYGSLLVWQLSRHDPEHLASALRAAQPRFSAARDEYRETRQSVWADHRQVSDESQLGTRRIHCACGHVSQNSDRGNYASQDHAYHASGQVNAAIDAEKEVRSHMAERGIETPVTPTVLRKDVSIGTGGGWLARYHGQYFVVSESMSQPAGVQVFRSDDHGSVSDWDELASGRTREDALRQLQQRPYDSSGRVLSPRDVLDEAEADNQDETDAEVARHEQEQGLGGPVLSTRSLLDRSAAHEALLSLSPEFAGSDLDASSQMITEMLRGFYASGGTNMYTYARQWVSERDSFTGCWNGFCILGDACNWLDHCDATGHSWQQRRGTEYCPACRACHKPSDCPRGYDSPVVTLTDKGSPDVLYEQVLGIVRGIKRIAGGEQ
jgi:Large polyvalent protein associated domain 29